MIKFLLSHLQVFQELGGSIKSWHPERGNERWYGWGVLDVGVLYLCADILVWVQTGQRRGFGARVNSTSMIKSVIKITATTYK